MKLNLSKDELHDLHVALAEVLDFFKKRKQHQKKHDKQKCDRCADYERLRVKFVKLCDCSDESELSLKDRLGEKKYLELKKIVDGHHELLEAIGKL